MNDLSAIESIFLAALDKGSAEERAAFLDQACGRDTELRGHVERLLKAHPNVGGFLQSPAQGAASTIDEPPIAERTGAIVGPYRLMEQIGEGGMGLVYVAEQQRPVRRKIALKVIKPGMDSRDVIARFEAERQALALMDHPNIAKVFDAGTTDTGLPYFVMELVKGVPITDYCDQAQLTPRERVQLFIPVCQAVQHAHQKGIIHRDLKPSNVLVTLHDGTPVVKVIDFGVAKAIGQNLTEKTIYTRFAQMIGTPLYMSPEQAEMSGLDIDTRTDVYALGVLLYELLTGTTPFDRQRIQTAAFDEIRRIIREEEPPKPSTRLSTLGSTSPTVSAHRKSELNKLSALVKGELDWIVMKCLEKDRTRRYETANGLARDVQRYLADESVEACPPSSAYKLRKFGRKHRKALVTAASFAVLLLAGTVLSAWQAVRATVAEREAERHSLVAVANEEKARSSEQAAGRERDEVRGLNDRLRRLLYTSQMSLAHHAWNDGGLARLKELLEEARPKPGQDDLRGFEWNYLNRLYKSGRLKLEEGGFPNIICSAISPDGKRMATSVEEDGSNRGVLKVWDAATGRVVWRSKGHEGSVWGLSYSPDGKRLASAGSDHKVRVWELEDGHEPLELVGHSDFVAGVAFNHDGSRIASASWDGKVNLWDACAGGPPTLSFKGHTSPVFGLAFSPDGARIASAGDDLVVRTWSTSDGHEILMRAGHTAAIHGVAYSRDGARIASASEDGTVCVWDASKDAPPIRLLGHTGTVWAVAFHPDGKRLASVGFDGAVKLWDVTGERAPLTLKGGGKNLAFSPDGRRLLSLCIDNTVKIWDVPASGIDAETGVLRGHTKAVNDLAYSPDGARMASASDDGTVRLWDLHKARALRTLKQHDGWAVSVTYSPDGTRIASAGSDGLIFVNDPETGEILHRLVGHTGQVAVKFSPDGTRLASAGHDRTVRIWDTATGREVLKHRGHNDLVWDLAFSPDGTRLASSGFDHAAKVWDVARGVELLTIPAHSILHSVAYSPDGTRLTAGSGEGIVYVWDATTGREVLALKGHSDRAWGVAYSPDGSRIASSSNDQTVRVWDAATGQETLTLTGHAGEVWNVAFSPDGRWLASAGADHVIRLWDARPFEPAQVEAKARPE